MHTIREFTYTATDYQAVADLFEAVCGNNHLRPEDIQHLDEIRGAEIPFARFVAEAEGKIIAESAYGHSIWFQSAKKLNLNITIHPEVGRNDLREEMYVHLVKEASRHDPEAFSVSVIEDDSADMRFWSKHGFQQVAREPRFVIDLIQFDPILFDTTIPNVEDQGIKILSLAELKVNDPDWLLRWWQMEWVILKDLATDEEPAIRRTLEQFEKDVQHPAIISEAFFFAVDGDQYVAIAGLTRYDEITYMSDLTWAIPSHQNRGIEMTLKLKALKWAKEKSATYIIDEAIEDDLINKINLKLGFEHLPAWLVYERHL